MKKFIVIILLSCLMLIGCEDGSNNVLCSTDLGDNNIKFYFNDDIVTRFIWTSRNYEYDNVEEYMSSEYLKEINSIAGVEEIVTKSDEMIYDTIMIDYDKLDSEKANDYFNGEIFYQKDLNVDNLVEFLTGELGYSCK